MSTPLDWSYRTTQIPATGLAEKRAATSAERAVVAADLEVVSCEELVAEFVVKATGQGHYRLAGKVTARLTQNCVVTLDPILQSVAGGFDVEFWPPGDVPQTGEDEIEALSAAEIEPIEHGMIDAGRIIFDTLSASLDPYPRKPGAEFAADAAGLPPESAAGPFAALQKLKDQH
jgi:uncharacterized metal-binding protein YceD (DUF177 family)